MSFSSLMCCSGALVMPVQLVPAGSQLVPAGSLLSQLAPIRLPPAHRRATAAVSCLLLVAPGGSRLAPGWLPAGSRLAPSWLPAGSRWLPLIDRIALTYK